MYKNSTLLAIGTVLLLSLYCVESGSAFQIVTRPPAVDFLSVAQMNGWTGVPLQMVSFLIGAGLIVLIGLGIRRLRHHHHGYQS
jgi:hypothetical protein